MTVITRAQKGEALTHAELDGNMIHFRDGIDLAVPKTMGTGIKVDSTGTRTFPWHDLVGTIYVTDYADPNAPDIVTYSAGIKQNRYAINDEAQILFHIPHDYVMGSDIFIHAHWSTTSSLITGGGVTWGFDLIYAKGHNQGAFTTPVTIVEYQLASTIPYQHMIAEGAASISGGGASLLDTDELEVDGLIFGRVYLAANDITVSSGPVPSPFLHTVDIHYQSTTVGTKQRSPNFWT
jgi:hypothetical protein